MDSVGNESEAARSGSLNCLSLFNCVTVDIDPQGPADGGYHALIPEPGAANGLNV